MTTQEQEHKQRQAPTQEHRHEQPMQKQVQHTGKAVDVSRRKQRQVPLTRRVQETVKFPMFHRVKKIAVVTRPLASQSACSMLSG